MSERRHSEVDVISSPPCAGRAGVKPQREDTILLLENRWRPCRAFVKFHILVPDGGLRLMGKDFNCRVVQPTDRWKEDWDPVYLPGMATRFGQVGAGRAVARFFGVSNCRYSRDLELPRGAPGCF